MLRSIGEFFGQGELLQVDRFIGNIRDCKRLFLHTTDVDDGICEAIMAHNPATGVPRNSDLAKALFAVDELSGFIVACAKVRPNGISDMKAKSVKKKLKDKAFAAAVSREDIRIGIEELGVDQTEHIQFCIDAIRPEAERLGI